jgi:hypothetical protein
VRLKTSRMRTSRILQNANQGCLVVIIPALQLTGSSPGLVETLIPLVNMLTRHVLRAEIMDIPAGDCVAF